MFLDIFFYIKSKIVRRFDYYNAYCTFKNKVTTIEYKFTSKSDSYIPVRNLDNFINWSNTTNFNDIGFIIRIDSIKIKVTNLENGFKFCSIIGNTIDTNNYVSKLSLLLNKGF